LSDRQIGHHSEQNHCSHEQFSHCNLLSSTPNRDSHRPVTQLGLPKAEITVRIG
jgi:hypothetical protein